MASREDALAELRTLFASLRLPSSLVDWAWNELVQGKSQTEVMLDIEQTSEFGNRFPGIALARQHGVTPLTPAEYVTYETTAAENARRYGLPDEFWQVGNPAFDNRLANAMANGVSARQYVERLDNGFAKVADAPNEVREGFARLFGVRGDAALATVYLDPANAQTHLERMAGAAEVAGTGDRFGIQVDQSRAFDLAAYDFSRDQLQSGFGTLADQEQLFQERTNRANKTRE